MLHPFDIHLPGTYPPYDFLHLIYKRKNRENRQLTEKECISIFKSVIAPVIGSTMFLELYSHFGTREVFIIDTASGTVDKSVVCDAFCAVSESEYYYALNDRKAKKVSIYDNSGSLIVENAVSQLPGGASLAIYCPPQPSIYLLETDGRSFTVTLDLSCCAGDVQYEE